MRIRIIDAFTDRPFAGNPAAVCLLDGPTRGPTRPGCSRSPRRCTSRRPRSPTRSPTSADADWALRWFTPEVETNLCGHATLATAHAMHRDRGTAGTVRFMSRSGVLVAHTSDDGTITLDFPAARLSEAPAPERPGRGARRHPAGDLRHRRARRPAGRPRRRGGRAGARARPRRHRPHRAPRRHPRRHRHRRAPPTPTPATTSSRASSPPPTASPRIPSRVAPTRPSPRTGRAASAATGSPACRPRRAAASCARRSTAIASTSPATRSSSSTAR